MVDLQMNRRQALRGAGSVAVLGAAGSAIAACGDKKHKTNSAENNRKVSLPTYTPFPGVTPDLRGTPEGVPDGFLKFGKPVAAITDKPGSGGSVTAMLEIGATVPPTLSKNAYWQELNRRLGLDLKLDMVNEDGYPEKVATVVAGGDIPDLVQLHTDMPRLPELLQAKFADLSDYIGGDAVKKYPMLANIPSYAWPNAVYNGGIYGVPYSLAPVGAIMFSRQDVLAKNGITAKPTSGAEFLELCKSLTDAKKHVWSSCNPSGFLLFVQEMLGIPSTWTQTGGKFTNVYTTDTYRQALSTVAQWWKAGIFHPDSFTVPPDQQITFFQGGTVLLDMRQNTWWNNYYTQRTGSFALGAIPPPDFNGKGLGKKSLSSGSYTITAIKKASKSRIEEILRVMNYTAAPFGTEEYVFCRFGSAGKDYTTVKGEPALTKKGSTDVNLPLSYVAARPPVLYITGNQQATRADYDYQKTVVPTGRKDATIGLASDTYSKSNATISTPLSDMISQVIQGRKSLKDWDDTVKTWRTAGGDAMANEYGQAYAATPH